MTPGICYDLLDEQMTEKDKTFYKKMGQRLAAMRKEQLLTQVQLCKLLGISQQLMAAYEAGQRKIPASMLPALSKIFGVSTGELLGMNEKPSKRGPVPRLQKQIDMIRRLPRTKQRFVMEMIETVINQQGSAS